MRWVGASGADGRGALPWCRSWCELKASGAADGARWGRSCHCVAGRGRRRRLTLPWQSKGQGFESPQLHRSDLRERHGAVSRQMLVVTVCTYFSHHDPACRARFAPMRLIERKGGRSNTSRTTLRWAERRPPERVPRSAEAGLVMAGRVRGPAPVRAAAWRSAKPAGRSCRWRQAGGAGRCWACAFDRSRDLDEDDDADHRRGRRVTGSTKVGAARLTPIGNAMAAAMSMGFVRLSDNSVVVATPVSPRPPR